MCQVEHIRDALPHVSLGRTVVSVTSPKEVVMKTKVVEDAGVVTYVAVCDPGDEAFSSLVEFARGEKLAAA